MKLKVLLLVTLCYSLNSFPQTKSTIFIVNSKSNISVTGKASFIKWKSIAHRFNGYLNYTTLNKKEYKKLTVNIEVKGITSKQKIRDKVIYKSLKEETFPWIKFTSSSFIYDAPNANNSIKKYLLKGIVTMAGIKHGEKIPIVIKHNANGNILIEGVFTLKLTDFHIKPPTVLFGLIRINNQIKINFNLFFDKGQ